jgi:Immunity protein Imm1
MRIQDNDSVFNVTSPQDIEAALRRRHSPDRNSFWLSHGAELYPVINIMMRGDLAYLTYIPNEDHPGFTSVGISDARGDTTFFHNDSNEETEIANYSVVPFSDALNAAQEFAISKEMPKCIRWTSLVLGEP